MNESFIYYNSNKKKGLHVKLFKVEGLFKQLYLFSDHIRVVSKMEYKDLNKPNCNLKYQNNIYKR